MRDTFITPLWKGGDRTVSAAYRPVALITHLSKLMERLIYVPMVKYLEDTGKMDQSQHGARGRKSTLFQLLAQYDQVLRIPEDGGKYEIVYLDLTKAFDKVYQSLLLRRLKSMGIFGSLGNKIGRFLTN